MQRPPQASYKRAQSMRFPICRHCSGTYSGRGHETAPAWRRCRDPCCEDALGRCCGWCRPHLPAPLPPSAPPAAPPSPRCGQLLPTRHYCDRSRKFETFSGGSCIGALAPHSALTQCAVSIKTSSECTAACERFCQDTKLGFYCQRDVREAGSPLPGGIRVTKTFLTKT